MKRLLIVIAVSLVCVLGARSAVGQVGWPEFPLGRQKQPGQVMSEQTRLEIRTWARAYWEFMDTGQRPAWAQGPMFSRPEEIPANWVPFADAFDVFGKIYQHRLQPDPRLPGYYTFGDLLRDDPTILQAFRNYTITGELKTQFDADATALGKHVELALSGLFGEQADGVLLETSFILAEGNDLKSDTKISVVASTLYFADGNDFVVGNELRFDTKVSVVASTVYLGDLAVIAPGTPLPTPARPEILECLLEWVKKSRLGWGSPGSDRGCVPRCLYTKDTAVDGWLWYDYFAPGFDCDDFSDAMLAWLLHHLRGMYPNMEGYNLWFEWTDCNGNPLGHSVVYIKIGDYYYIIEPQTGEIKGPYPASSTPDPRVFLTPCLGGDYDHNKPVKWRLVPPNERPKPFFEPPPWHTDPFMQKKLIDCIRRCYGDTINPNDYIWDPNNPGTPCTTGCGCDPTKWVPNTTP